MLLYMQTNKFTVANSNFTHFALKYSVQQFKIKTVTCHMFKGMECHWSCAVNNQKIKFCSTVNWVTQVSHINTPIKRIPKKDLRLGSFGWVLFLFFKGGRGGGFVHWEGAAWPVPRYYHVICLQTKCETGQQKLAEIQTRCLPYTSVQYYQQIN
jgi:hypothetical protein